MKQFVLKDMGDGTFQEVLAEVHYIDHENPAALSASQNCMLKILEDLYQEFKHQEKRYRDIAEAGYKQQSDNAFGNRCMADGFAAAKRAVEIRIDAVKRNEY